MATKGCHCGVCRPPEVLARLALDEADGADRLVRALRQRFRSPADALPALGIDQDLLEEGERMMMKGRDTRNRDQMMPEEYDRRGRDMRGNRDQGEEGGEGEELEELMTLLQEMPTADRRLIMDWARSRMPTYDSRRGARDDPPPFYGQPMTGGSMNWSDEREARDYRKRREAEDRRRRRFAHDMAAHDDTFARMFPDAMRIRTTGF
jgi:hypothetical protein